MSTPADFDASAETASLTAQHIGGFALIARALDLQMSADKMQTPIRNTEGFAERLSPGDVARAVVELDSVKREAQADQAASIASTRQALAEYVAHIARMAKTHKSP